MVFSFKGWMNFEDDKKCTLFLHKDAHTWVMLLSCQTQSENNIFV